MKSAAIHVNLQGLYKSFQEGERVRQVFDDASLIIGKGEFVAILGRSGSGKSTLLNLISGIELPDAGDVRIGDKSITALSETKRTLFRRQNIGFVFQFFNLIPTLTASENIALPLELNGVSEDEINQRTQRWLTDIKLLDRADSFPDILSGGEQQRVALARAMVHEPALLLADEPTGNLDTETATHVLDLIKQLASHSKTTVVVATHSAEAASAADRVFTVENGHIIST
ncbi:MAG: ABC transporter ATP-binding protein [Gammaproteobacteria bacterium]|nr:ABC transporter ATP-binding protein [Gammaproteobacteria bacterium]